MNKWKLFPMWEARPENPKHFSKKQRPELELAVACQVAELLSRFGEISEWEVDNSASPLIAEPQTFQQLSLEKYPLEDDGNFLISQLPYSADGCWTEHGAHSVIKEDENGKAVLCLTVWDPEIDAEQRIHDERGKVVNRLVLQELYEALSIMLLGLGSENASHATPHDTADFPFPVVEVEFLALAMQFES